MRRPIAEACRTFLWVSLLATPALANPYDDCILQYMGAAQNNDAIIQIEKACISKTSISIPYSAQLKFFEGRQYAMPGTSGGLNPVKGFLLHVNNNIEFNITELFIKVTTKSNNKQSTYNITNFNGQLPAGAIGFAPNPSNDQIIKSGEKTIVFFTTPEIAETVGDFTKIFLVDIGVSKGIPPN